MSATAPTDPLVLLEQHVPVLRYDSQEPYFADSAAEWTDNPGNQLRRSDGSGIAAATPTGGQPQLALPFLGPHQYASGEAVTPGDRIAAVGHNYVAQAQAMHAKPGYANRVYGHWTTGSDGRVWLAYWFFYFYNDYNLVGPLFPAGLHEGDWEMIQLRLDPAGQVPDLAVYAQHAHAASQPWTAIERVGDQPIVYPARGSHASYFHAGTHWTGIWFDHANGQRNGPPLTLEIIRGSNAAQQWAWWPGLWGGTEPKRGIDHPLEDSSPRGPGGHSQWNDPTKLLDTAEQHAAAVRPPPASVLPAPAVSASRDGSTLHLEYSTVPDAAVLVVAINAAGKVAPPTLSRQPIDRSSGVVAIENALPGDAAYEIHCSVAAAGGQASKSVDIRLPAFA